MQSIETLLTFDDQLRDTGLRPEDGLDLHGVLHRDLVHGQSVRETLRDDLVLGSGHDLDGVDEPLDRDVGVTHDAFKDGVVALARRDVSQRPRELILKP